MFFWLTYVKLDTAFEYRKDVLSVLENFPGDINRFGGLVLRGAMHGRSYAVLSENKCPLIFAG